MHLFFTLIRLLARLMAVVSDACRRRGRRASLASGVLRPIAGLLLVCSLLAVVPQQAIAASLAPIPQTLLAPLAADDTDDRLAGIAALGELASPAAAAVLDALGSDRLFATESGRILIQDAQGAVSDPETARPWHCRKMLKHLHQQSPACRHCQRAGRAADIDWRRAHPPGRRAQPAA